MKKKKLIIYPANRWAEELLTYSRLKRTEFLVEDQENIDEANRRWGGIKHVISFNDFVKTVHDPNEYVIIISDTSRYQECAGKLSLFGFAENTHFFNGWKLDKAFYSMNKEYLDWYGFETGENYDIEENKYSYFAA